jgi:thiopurine S-methyltransferase
MEASFWLQRWQDDLIGFHQAEVNPHLVRFWSATGVAAGERVLVPLCGKSRDMLWLGERHPVLGVELSPIAVSSFFREAGLVPQCREEGAFSVCEAQGVRLLCGNFFQLDAEQLGGVRGVYDRASLIALPPALRREFASRLGDLLPAGVVMLMVTLDYEQSQMSGPPFAVAAPEIEALFGARWSLRLLDEQDVLATHPAFQERGLTRLRESVYLLQKT